MVGQVTRIDLNAPDVLDVTATTTTTSSQMKLETVWA